MVARRFFLLLLSILMAAAPLSAQGTGTVTGRVTDALSQQPVTGVSVVVGTRGTLTDDQGRFRLTGVPVGTQTVRAVSIGYREAAQPVSVQAGATVNVDFMLQAQAVALSELVVIGYGTQRAGNVTGAIKQVSAEEFNTGRIVSPEQLIQSKVAGVHVVDSNEPGGGISLRIRGATSVNASSEPLYVIDGVAVGGGAGGGLSAGRNPLNFLNPNDIESITVLKDAAAASIYGANASSGVVIITTKKARSLGIEYTGSVSASQITRRPDMLNADEFRAAVAQYAPQNLAQLGQANTNWYDLVTRSAMGQDHNVSVSTSSTNNDLRFSVGYLDQDGIVAGTTVERISATLNYNQRLLNDNLTFRASLKGSRLDDQFTPDGVISNAAQMGPTQPVLDPTSLTGYAEYPLNQFTSPDNPLAILQFARDNGRTYRSVGNAQAEYRLPFFSALKAVANVGYDVTKATREQFMPSILHREVVGRGTKGRYHRRDESFQTGLLETYLNYNAALGVLPGNIDITGGYSYSQGRGEYPGLTVEQLSTDVLEVSGIPSGLIKPPTLWIDENKLISFFGRVNYNFKDRYLVSGSLRRDGSSRFGPDNAWGTFPSLSAAWRISEEPFMKGFEGLNDLKLRASWGKVGNQSFANYQQYITYTVGDAATQVFFDGEYVATVRPNPADPNLRWEETDSYNLGVDVGFGRFNGSIDVYQKDTDGLIFDVPAGVLANLSNHVTTNIGSMRNKGIEFTLGAQVLNGGGNGLSWSTNFNAGYNKNELTQITPFGGSAQRIERGDVAGGVGTKIQVLTPGVPVNSFFVFKHKMENGKPLYRDVTGDGTINNDDLFEDLNDDGRINDDDRRPYKDPAPKWILGHSSFLKYGKFDGSFTLRAYLGNYTYNNVASNLGTYGEVNRGSPFNLHRSVLTTGFRSPFYQSDYYVEDASFLRMDNLTVGYSLTYRGQPLRVFGTVQNVFTVTDYSGVDPTAGLNGIDNNIYPRSRTFAAGLNVRF